MQRRVPKTTATQRISTVVRKGGIPAGRVRVQLDRRTLVPLKSMAKVEAWRKRYPNLQVLP